MGARHAVLADTSGGINMTLTSLGQDRPTRAKYTGRLDNGKLRAIIAKHLDVDIRRVTDDAHLSRDLGADWLDRLELIIVVEEHTGVEITDDEADRIELVGDLTLYVNEIRRV
jgi:acyl carrier protein